MGNKTTRLHPKTVQELISHIHVDFDPAEIHDWYDEFKKSCNKGKDHLDKAAFIRIYNSLFLGDGTEFACNVFRTFDSNNDGLVDFHEFIVGLCVSGSSDVETKMEWAFRMYDQNGDGYITRDELQSVITAVYKMHLPMDMDDVSSPKTLTKELFESLDSNKDDAISFSEFKEGVKRHPILVNLLQMDPSGHP
ncbi:hypothetical protein ScPMuIL_015067 [Solemya velum]